MRGLTRAIVERAGPLALLWDGEPEKLIRTRLTHPIKTYMEKHTAGLINEDFIMHPLKCSWANLKS